MSIGPLQLVLIVVIIILLFGTKKLGNIGSDLGKAIRDFKKGMGGDDKDKDKHGHKNESTDGSEKMQADEPSDSADDATRKSEKPSSDRPRH